MAGSTAFTELITTILEYETDNLTERERIAVEGEQAWTRARGAQGIWSPGLIRLPLLVLEGEWSTARQQLRETLQLPLIMSRKFHLSSLLAQIARRQGDTAVAWKLVAEVLRDGPATAPGNAHFVAGLKMLNIAASLSIDAGELNPARGWLETADRWLDWSGSVLGRADHLMLWATLERAAGDLAQSRVTAARAFETGSRPRQPLALVRVHRLLGELATESGEWGEAGEHLDTSLQLAVACKAPYEQALTISALARLRQAERRRDEAIQLLEAVRAICTRLSAKPALERIDALAAEVAGSSLPALKYPNGLTGREVEVLRLVAAGLTNAQIAERLFVSRRTVDQHLRSIYTKLGVSSRAAATRFAVERELT
jgi:ATP/maltotriose-dependent transcriptional regulator MalT